MLVLRRSQPTRRMLALFTYLQFNSAHFDTNLFQSGPVADRARVLLNRKQHGSIVASEEVIREVSKNADSFVEKIEIERVPRGASDSIRQVCSSQNFVLLS